MGLLVLLAALAWPAGRAQAAESDTVQQLRRELHDSSAVIESLKQRVERLEKERGTGPGAAADDDREGRLQQLEESVEDLQEQTGGRVIVNAFDAQRINVGGFLHTVYTHVKGEQRSSASFDRQNFELLIRAQLNESWSAFLAQGFLRESSGSFDDDNDGVLDEPGERLRPDIDSKMKTPLIIAWTNYFHSDALNVQLGRFITPHGIINIDHFPAILLDPEQPQFLRPFSGDTLFPNFITGAQVYGARSMGASGQDTLSYNIYAANSTVDPEEPVYGGRIAYALDRWGLTLGVNAASGQRAGGTDYDLTGADVLFKRGPWVWKNEYFTTNESGADDRRGWYTQPAWHITPRWVVFYRYDFLDNGLGTGDRVEHAVGVNYLPYDNVRLRLIHTQREYDAGGGFPAADADIWQLSGTFSF